MNTINFPREKNLRLIINLLIIYFYVFIAFIMSYFLTNQNLRTSLFYCVVILTSVTLASFAELIQKNKIFYNLFMFSSFFVLFFIYGFRNYTAIDDPSYINIFENVSRLGWYEYFKISTLEPGYLLLNSIVRIFTDNYLYMQLLSSFIPLALFYYGFHKYRKLISIPTAVFLLCSMIYFQMLAVALVRMFIALGIVLVAFRFIPEKKPKKYILYILAAGMFHYSSLFLVFLVYFSLNKENLKRKTAKIYTLLFFLSPIIFIAIGKFIVPLLGSRYIRYGSIDFINLSFGAFTTFPLVLLLIFYNNKFLNIDKLYFKLFVFVYAISIIISMFGSMVGLGRLLFYSYAAFILAVSMINEKVKFNPNKIIFMFIIIFYGFIYLFYSQFTNNLHVPNLFPYQNIWFDV